MKAHQQSITLVCWPLQKLATEARIKVPDTAGAMGLLAGTVTPDSVASCVPRIRAERGRGCTRVITTVRCVAVCDANLDAIKHDARSQSWDNVRAEKWQGPISALYGTYKQSRLVFEPG